MPTSPVSGQKFSEPPPGKKALTADEMQQMVSAPLEAAAQILGGTVTKPGDVPETPAERMKEKYAGVEIPEDDKKAYIRSLLSKQAFKKTYSLFGGAIAVTFRTRTAKEADSLVLSQEQPVDKHRRRMQYSVDALSMVSDSKPEPVELDSLDDVASSAVYEAFNRFEALCEEMFRRANDPDFWTRTAGRI
jgi:hypothetical protein